MRSVLACYILIFLFQGCIREKVIATYGYHPYLAARLCNLTIGGNISSIDSISILLNSDNISDNPIDKSAHEALLVDHNAEFNLYNFSKNAEFFSEKIPCRNQYIRIRYLREGNISILDLYFDKNKKNIFYVKINKNNGVMYAQK